MGGVGDVGVGTELSNVVFYAQSTIKVMSG